MLGLLEAELRLWQTGACIKPANLRRAGMQERHIRCCGCGRSGQAVEQYVALQRTAPLRATPLPDAALRLMCMDCYAESDVAAGVAPTADAVEDYCEDSMMGALEACAQLLGLPRAHWSGQMGSGAMY